MLIDLWIGHCGVLNEEWRFNETKQIKELLVMVLLPISWEKGDFPLNPSIIANSFGDDPYFLTKSAFAFRIISMLRFDLIKK